MQQYYIQLFSPHGLIRFQNPEIGRDKDTGGQTKYVLELLENLSRHPQVRKVDLFTRRINDEKVSDSYNNEIEIVNEKARIVRISCGGGSYLPKESLWNYLDKFADNAQAFIKSQKDFPDIVHGHYADGNYIAHKISRFCNVPFIATGHSLGRNKQKILLSQGLSAVKINKLFNMQRRIEVEEQVLTQADAIIVGTNFEIDNHYGLYENRAKGKFQVIPPGINTETFFPFYRYDLPSFKMTVEQEQVLYHVNADIERFLFNPAKPLILSIGRADKRKNFESIIQAYGEDRELQAMANLAIFAGVRKDISKMPDDEKDTLTNLLLLMDKYDLYGKMALPKKNDPGLDVPEIYRLAARKKGVFVNATPGENFGLTIIEAAACGLPVVASPTGGPKEILEHCENGILTNVEEPSEIAAAVKTILSNEKLWEQYSSSGIVATSHLYSWEAHCKQYVDVVSKIFQRRHSKSTTANGKKKEEPAASKRVRFFVFGKGNSPHSKETAIVADSGNYFDKLSPSQKQVE
ncbi:MAG: glycosyltransferase [Agriterribacter sp.]